MEPIVWLAIIFEGGLLLLALALGGWFNYPPLEQIIWSGEALVWGILATFPLFFSMGYCTRSAWAPLRSLMKQVEREIVPLFADCSMLQLALISLLAGVGEETLFQGVIQTGLSELIHPWPALAATSVLFGLGHWITPSYGVLAGIVGGYLGLLTMASGNLLPAILAHALYDFAALVYLKGAHSD